MRLIKNNANNAAELYKLLGNNKTVLTQYGIVHVNKFDLLSNPANDSVVVYTKDGSDYEIYIRYVLSVVDMDLN